MGQVIGAIGAGLLAVGAATGAAAQASFDCGRATTAVEVAICGDPYLSQLDRQMAAAYARARSGQPQAVRDRILAEQRAWLSQRGGCGSNRECLIFAMQARIAALGVQAAPVAPEAGGLTGLYCTEDAVMGVQEAGADLRFDFMFFAANGHACGTELLTARRSDAGWVASEAGCRLFVTVEGGDIAVRTDTPGACQAAYCGARAAIGEFRMPLSAKRPGFPDPFIGGVGERPC